MGLGRSVNGAPITLCFLASPAALPSQPTTQHTDTHSNAVSTLSHGVAAPTSDDARRIRDSSLDTVSAAAAAAADASWRRRSMLLFRRLLASCGKGRKSGGRVFFFTSCVNAFRRFLLSSSPQPPRAQRLTPKQNLYAQSMLMFVLCA